MSDAFIRLPKALFKPELLTVGPFNQDLKIKVMIPSEESFVSIIADDWHDAEAFFKQHEIDLGMIFDLYLKTRDRISRFPTQFTWNDLAELGDEWILLSSIHSMTREIKFGVKRQMFEPMHNYKERVHKYLTFPRIAKLISSIEVDKIMLAEIEFHDTSYTVRELAELRGGFSTYQMDKLREIVKQNLRIAMAVETKAKILDEIYNKEEKVVDTESGEYEIPEGFRIASLHDSMHVITDVIKEPRAFKETRYGIFTGSLLLGPQPGLFRANKK